METTEILLELQDHTNRLADEIIQHHRNNPDYLNDLIKIERKLAVLLADEDGHSLLIKVKNGRLFIN